MSNIQIPRLALYSLNIKAFRDRLDQEGLKDIPISINIGEEQRERSSACQAALGVAIGEARITSSAI